MFGLRRSNSSSSKSNKKSDKSSRTPSLTESAIRSVANEEEWEDLDGKSEIRSRVSSRSEKKGGKKSRSRSRSRDRKRRDGDKRDSDKRKDKRVESIDGPSRTARSGRGRGAEDLASDMRATGFNQFPGQYDQSYGMPQSAVPQLSSNVQNQFPGQFPVDYSHNAFERAGKTTSEGGYGLAADFYGDQGQSVSMQPGVRPPSPDIKMHHPPHLQPASSIPTPAQDTGNGSAADFYGTSGSTSKPPRQSSSSRPFRPEHGPSTPAYAHGHFGPGAGTSDAASFYTASGTANGTWAQHGSNTSENNGGVEGAYYIPAQPPRPGQPDGSSFPTAAVAGAAGLAAGAYAAHHHASGTSPLPVNHPQEDQFTYRPPSIVGHAIEHKHRHTHRGPLDRLFDLVQNKEDVRRMEEYTEYIGVCKYCFDPKSSARDAPRPHHFHRRRSSDSFKRRRSNESLRQSARRKGKHSGVDKDARYHSSSSSENGGKRKNKAGWLGAGLAGYSIAKVGGALWNQKHEFNDGHSAKSGRSDRPPSYQSRGSDISRGVVRPHGRTQYVHPQNPDALTVRHPEPIRLSRSRSRERYVTHAGSSRAHGAQSSGVYVRRRSRSRSRSHSPGIGEILGVTAPKSKLKSTSSKKKTKQKGFFNFGNGSSSSSDSGLAFGGSVSRRKSSPRRRSRRHSRDRLDSTLLGIGATAAALAAAQSRRRPEVIAVKEKPSGHRNRDRGSVLGRPSSADEDGWESVSESDASSATSGLAFGDLHYDKDKQPARRSSRESLSSDSSGTGKWGWRWGSSSQKQARPKQRPTHIVEPAPSLPRRESPQSSRIQSYSSPAQPTPARPADVASLVSSTAMRPMQHVEPMPFTDSSSTASAQPRYETLPERGWVGQARDGRSEYSSPTSERRKNRDRPELPAPRRSQTDPSSGVSMGDAAVLGGAAAAAAGIYAATRGRKDDSSVRFEDDRQSRADSRKERRNDNRDENHEAERERERAHESERTRTKRENAERKAYDRARENERQAIADRAEHEAQYSMSGALTSPPPIIQPQTSQSPQQPVNALSDRERELEALIAAKKRELAERQAREGGARSTPPPPYPSHNDSADQTHSSYDPATGYYTQTFKPSRRDTEDDIYSRDTPEDQRRGRSGVEYPDTARDTAARVVADLKEKYTSPQPTQAEFFAPKELEKSPVLSEEEERQKKLKEWVPNADADIHYTMHAGDFKRFDPKTQVLIRKDGVPHLGLIVPTPPVSMAGSVKGDKSPVSPHVVTEREIPNQSAEKTRDEKAANRVSWGPDDTRFYEIESPAHSPRLPPAGAYPSDPVIEIKNDSRSEPSTSYRLSDLPSAAAPFAADKFTGEPETIEVVRERPGSSFERPGIYQSPFFETVSDLGMSLDSPDTEGAPPVRGFIEGEVDEPTPVAEKRSYLPGAFEDGPPPTVSRETKPSSRDTSRVREVKDMVIEDEPLAQSWSSLPPRNLEKEDRDLDTRSETWDTGLSKKDKKRKGKSKTGTREIVDFASEPAMSERASSVIEESVTHTAGDKELWEKPLTKKEQRKRDKLPRRDTDDIVAEALEPFMAVQTPPTKDDDEQIFEAPLSKKDKKRRDKLARKDTDDFASATVTPLQTIPEPASDQLIQPVIETIAEQEDTWTPTLSRKEQKKREKLARQTTDDFASPIETPVKEQPESNTFDAAANDEWSVPLSKKEQKKRDKLARQNTDEFSTPVETPVKEVSVLDEWQAPLSKKEQKKRDKLARQNTDDFSTPVETPVEEAPVADEWQIPLSKKEQKKRDKLARQNTEDFPTPVETPVEEAAVANEWQVPLSKKEQKKRDKLARQNTDDFSEPISATNGTPSKEEELDTAWVAPLSKKDKKKLEKERRKSLADDESSRDTSTTRDAYATSKPGSKRREERIGRETRCEAGDRREDKQSFGDIAKALIAGGAAGFVANDALKSHSDKRDEDQFDNRTSFDEKPRQRRGTLSRSPPYEAPPADRNGNTEREQSNYGVPGSFDEPERAETEEERRARKKKSRRSGDFDDNMSMISGYSERSSKSKRDKDESSSKKDKKGGLFGMFRRKSEDAKQDELDDRDDKKDKRHHRRRGTGDDDDTRSVNSGISRRSTADYGDIPSESKRERRRDREAESPPDQLSRRSTSSKEDLRNRDRSSTLTGEDKYQDQSFLAKRVEVEELQSLPAEPSRQPSRAPETALDSHRSADFGTPTVYHDESLRGSVMSPESPSLQSPLAETPPRPAALPLRPASATAVPLRFRRPPPSPSVSTTSTPNAPRQRAESFSSQVPVSPDSPASLITPRTRALRPRSIEIRREFQPLYLVEHNRKPSEIVLEDEPLPPLPISRETSCASSLRGSDGYESAVEEQLFEDAVETPLPAIAAEDEFKNFDLPVERSIETQQRFEDVLSSNQSTPRASTFPSDVFSKKPKREPEFYSWEDMLREEKEREERAARDVVEQVPQPESAPTVSTGLDFGTIASTVALGAGAALAADALTETDVSSHSRETTGDGSDMQPTTSSFAEPMPISPGPDSVFATPLEEPNPSFATPSEQPEPAFVLKPARKGSKKKGKPLKLGTAVVTSGEVDRETTEEIKTRNEQDTRDAVDGLFGETESPGKEWRSKRERKGSKSKRDSVDFKSKQPIAATPDASLRPLDSPPPAPTDVVNTEGNHPMTHATPWTVNTPQEADTIPPDHSVQHTHSEEQPSFVTTPITAIERSAETIKPAEDKWAFTPLKSDKKKKGKKGKGVQFDIWNDDVPAPSEPVPQEQNQASMSHAASTDIRAIETSILPRSEPEGIEQHAEPEPPTAESSVQPEAQALSKKELKKLKKGKKVDLWTEEPVAQALTPDEGRQSDQIAEVDQPRAENGTEEFDHVNSSAFQTIGESDAAAVPGVQQQQADLPVLSKDPPGISEWSKPLSKKDLKKLKKGKKVDIWAEKPSSPAEDRQPIGKDTLDDSAPSQPANLPDNMAETRLDLSAPQLQSEDTSSHMQAEAPVDAAESEAWSKPLSKKELKKLKKGKQTDRFRAESPAALSPDREQPSGINANDTGPIESSEADNDLDTHAETPQDRAQLPELADELNIGAEPEPWSKPLSKKELKKLKKGKQVDLWSDEPVNSPIEEPATTIASDSKQPISDANAATVVRDEAFADTVDVTSPNTADPSSTIVEQQREADEWAKPLSKKELKKLKKGKKVDLWSEEPSPAVDTEGKQIVDVADTQELNNEPPREASVADAGPTMVNETPADPNLEQEIEPWSRPLSKKELKKLRKGKQVAVEDESPAIAVEEAEVEEQATPLQEEPPTASSSREAPSDTPAKQVRASEADEWAKPLSKKELKKLKKGKKTDVWDDEPSQETTESIATVEQAEPVKSFRFATDVVHSTTPAQSDLIETGTKQLSKAERKKLKKARKSDPLAFEDEDGSGAVAPGESEDATPPQVTESAESTNDPLNDKEAASETVQTSQQDATTARDYWGVMAGAVAGVGATVAALGTGSRNNDKADDLVHREESSTAGTHDQTLLEDNRAVVQQDDTISERQSETKDDTEADNIDDSSSLIDARSKSTERGHKDKRSKSKNEKRKSATSTVLSWVLPGIGGKSKRSSDKSDKRSLSSKPKDRAILYDDTDKSTVQQDKDEKIDTTVQQSSEPKTTSSEPLWGPEDLVRDESDRFTRPDPDAPLPEHPSTEDVVAQEPRTEPGPSTEAANDQPVSSSPAKPRDFSNLWGEDDLIRDESCRMRGDVEELETSRQMPSVTEDNLAHADEPNVSNTGDKTFEESVESPSEFFVTKKSKKDKKRGKGKALSETPAEDTTMEEPKVLVPDDNARLLSLEQPSKDMESLPTTEAIATDKQADIDLERSQPSIETAADNAWDFPVKKRKGKKGKRAEAIESETAPVPIADAAMARNIEPGNPGPAAAEPLEQIQASEPIPGPTPQQGEPSTTFNETAGDDDWGFAPLKKRKGKKGKRAEADEQVSTKKIVSQPDNVAMGTATSHGDTMEVAERSQPTADEFVNTEARDNVPATDTIPTAEIEPSWNDELTIKKARKGKKSKRDITGELDSVPDQSSFDPPVEQPFEGNADKYATSTSPATEQVLATAISKDIEPGVPGIDTANDSVGPLQTVEPADTSDINNLAEEQSVEAAPEDEWSSFVVKKGKKGKKGKRASGIESTPMTPPITERPDEFKVAAPVQHSNSEQAEEHDWAPSTSKSKKKGRKAAAAAAALVTAAGALALRSDDKTEEMQTAHNDTAPDEIKEQVDRNRDMLLESELQSQAPSPAPDDRPLERMVMPSDLRDLPAPNDRRKSTISEPSQPSPDVHLETMKMPEDLRDLPPIQTDNLAVTSAHTSAIPTPLGDWDIDPLLDSNMETPDEMWARMSKMKKGKKSKRASAIGTPLSREVPLPADLEEAGQKLALADQQAESSDQVDPSKREDVVAVREANDAVSGAVLTSEPPTELDAVDRSAAITQPLDIPATPAKRSDAVIMTESPVEEVGISRFKESPPRDTESEPHRQQSSHVSSEGNEGVMGVDRMPLTRAPSELLEDERQPLLSRRESPERGISPVAVPAEIPNDDHEKSLISAEQDSSTAQAKPAETLDREQDNEGFSAFSLKLSKKDRKKAKQKRKTLDLTGDEPSNVTPDTVVEPAPVLEEPIAQTIGTGQELPESANPLSGPRLSVPDRFRLSRPLSKFDWADEVEAAEQDDEVVPTAIPAAEKSTIIPAEDALPSQDTAQIDPESEFPITRKISKKEKRKSKKAKGLDVEDDMPTPAADKTAEEGLQTDLSQTAELQQSDDRAREPQSSFARAASPPSNDIDFAATLAAGLAQSGFDSNMVVEDPVFHRRSSPPGTVAEVDPEEAFAIVNKKGRKGKKNRRSTTDTPSEEKTEQAALEEAAIPKEVPDLHDRPLTSGGKDDDFTAALTAGLGAAGFTAAMLSRSEEELSKAGEPEESIFTKSNKKKRKCKKNVDTEGDDLNDQNARRAVELAGETPTDELLQAAVEHEKQLSLDTTDLASKEVLDVPSTEQDPDNEEWALPVKKGKKGRGKGKRGSAPETDPTPEPVKQPVVETPLPDLPSKKSKKKKRGSAFDWNAETPSVPSETSTAAIATASNSTPKVGMMHTSEISQSLPTTVNKLPRGHEGSLATSERPRGISRDPSPAGIVNTPGWSFDVLDKSRDSGVPESPILLEDDKPRETIRDSGYDTITDRSNRNSGEKYGVPETIVETGASDLNADKESVASWEQWEMPVKKTRSQDVSEEKLATGSRGPSPVESTTKNRTSYLFATPPSNGQQSNESTNSRTVKDARNRSASPVIPLDYIPTESAERKRGKSASDVGLPDHAIKTTRRTDTPKQSFRDRIDSSSRIPPELSLRDVKGSQPSTSQTRLEALRSPTGISNTSASSLQRLKSPDPIRAPSITASIISNESATPSLRRTDRSASGDLRTAARRGDALNLGSAAAQTNNSIPPFRAPPTPPLNDDERGLNTRSRAMSDIYEGYGDGEPMATSPTRPQSVRRKQSMYIADMEARVEALVSENRRLQDAKGNMDVDGSENLAGRSIANSEMRLREKDAEINQIKAMLEPLKQELEQLKDLNATLTEVNKNLIADTNDRYGTLQEEHSYANAQWQQSIRELEKLRHEHSQLSNGMETIVRQHIDTALEDKDTEIARLRAELDYATSEIRALQARIQATASDDYLTVRDEDYFDGACQKLCQHVQAWVLRFSKSSDNRACRLSSDLKDDKLETRLDNTMLDGSDVDTLLVDRVRRRDVFMALVMMMVWEYIFTRYLFGMDREQRQKLKALEKILLEVGPPRAVAQWRATTLTLLARRPAFSTQKNLDHEAVTQEIYATLAALLPPPKSAEGQLQASLKKVLRLAIDLSIEMRTQRADYFMLPPPTPEYDSNGDLMRKTKFDAETMNERSGEYASNEELQSTGLVVKIVLFPLVMKKGDDSGEGGDEAVICPAQVLVATSKHSKRVVRRRSGVMDVDESGSRGTGARSRMSLISGGEGFI